MAGFSWAVTRPRAGRILRTCDPGLIWLGDLVAVAVVAALSFDTMTLTSGAIATAAMVALIASDDYRRPRLSLSVFWELPSLVMRLLVPFFLLGVERAVRQVDRWPFRAALACVVTVIAVRAVSFAAVRHLRRRFGLTRPTLIVGSGHVAARLHDRLRAHPELGARPIGFVTTPGSALPGPILGSEDDLGSIIARHRATLVIIVGECTRDIRSAVVASGTTAPEILIAPTEPHSHAMPVGPHSDDAWGVPLVWMRRPFDRPFDRRAKRAVDITISALVLLAAAPLLGALALAVRVSSPGPIFFRQTRIGQGGRPFSVLKFRSMRINSDSDRTWNVVGDDRVTPIGRVLRRTSLDELPQFLNVLKGDMSLVGPRPERPAFVEEFSRTIPHYADRHDMPVGITGWAQVNRLRGDTSIQERVEFDLQYAESWSLWRDMVILAMTASAMFHGDRPDPEPDDRFWDRRNTVIDLRTPQLRTPADPPASAPADSAPVI